MTPDDLASLLRLSSYWLNGTPPQVVIAGGIARSGTSFVEAILQAHPHVICLQEFMPLKTPFLAELLGLIARSTRAERELWSDCDGRHWRGYGPQEDNPRMLALLLTCLASTTSTNAVQGKVLNEVRVLFCKTPSSEFHFRALQSALPSIHLRYVHCIREPFACMRSNWEMPWVLGDDLDFFICDFAAMLGSSADALDAIRSAGVPVHILSAERTWSPASRQKSLAELFAFLSLDATGAVLARADDKVDPWPSERRRQPKVIVEESHAALLHGQPGLKRWLAAFGSAM